jgi:hypothetical protein
MRQDVHCASAELGSDELASPSVQRTVSPDQALGMEELQSRIKELETMQELIQQELGHVSAAASERGARLRWAAVVRWRWITLVLCCW